MPVNIPDAVLDEAFRLPPDRAIAYLASKGLKVTKGWKEALDYAAQQSFTVAQSMRMDILQSIRDELDAALKNGETFATFQKNLAPTLKAKGWWGEVNGVQTGSPWRLKTIYQTNMQGAYNAGRWDAQIKTGSSRPYFLYSSMQDPSRCWTTRWGRLCMRPSHRLSPHPTSALARARAQTLPLRWHPRAQTPTGPKPRTRPHPPPLWPWATSAGSRAVLANMHPCHGSAHPRQDHGSRTHA